MSIPDPTIQRLFRQHFPGKSALEAAMTKDARAALAEQIRQRLTGMKYVENISANYYHNPREPDRFVCAFSINEPEDRYSGRTQFTVRLNERGQLTIDHWRESILISNLDEIVAFVSACQEVVDRKIVQKKKTQKVRELKSQAIVAQVKKIAKEDKFDFYTETDTIKLKLHVSLTERDNVEIHIPFSKFQEVLPQLRLSIQSVRELFARGIKFKVSQSSPSSWRGQHWIKHDSL